MIGGSNLLFVIFIYFKCFSTSYSSRVKYPAKVTINAAKPFLNYSYDIKIEAGGQKWNLQLAPLDSIWFDDSHMNITENKTKMSGLETDILKNIRVYRDAKSGSVLYVEGKNVTGTLDSDNSIIYENKNHYIVKLGGNGTKETNNVLARKYDKNLSIDNETSNTCSFAKIFNANFRNRRKTSPEYNIMVKVMVDDELGPKIGYGEIFNYLVEFWIEVKQCFYMFDSPIINVLIALNMKPSMDHPFITKNLERLEGSDIIRDLSQWAESISLNNNLNDIVYVHTNRDLKSNGSSELKGLSENGKVCKDSLVVAIGEDIGADFDGVRTAAREIAYILGANYDKDTNCNPKDGYIMGDQGPEKTFYSFSKCSIESMSKHLAANWKLCKEKKLKYTG